MKEGSALPSKRASTISRSPVGVRVVGEGGWRWRVEDMIECGEGMS